MIAMGMCYNSCWGCGRDFEFFQLELFEVTTKDGGQIVVCVPCYEDLLEMNEIEPLYD